ncbi:MAG: hypothetical protein KKH98_14620 [Spirochaetes bacterium]|nr:hypothetical protein [Spirochaetota bacterium]
MVQTDQRKEINIKEQPGMDIILGIWWWFTWRGILAAIVGSILLGLLIAPVMKFLGADQTRVKNLFQLLSSVLVVVTQIYFLKRVIGRKFQGYTLTLIKDKDKE